MVRRLPEKNMTTALRQSLEAYKPELIDRFERIIRREYNTLVERFGPTMKNESGQSVYNSSYYSIWKESVRPCCQSNKVAGDLRGKETTYTLNDAAIAARGEAYALATIEAWEAKISAKMGELTEAECRRMDGQRFLITGKRGDLAVSIEQDMIVNVSVKGKLFNQFPARIYVDGKFTSEAKYKKLPAVAPAAAADDLSGWVPEDDPEAWKARDAALIAAAAAKRQA